MLAPHLTVVNERFFRQTWRVIFATDKLKISTGLYKTCSIGYKRVGYCLGVKPIFSARHKPITNK